MKSNSMNIVASAGLVAMMACSAGLAQEVRSDAAIVSQDVASQVAVFNYAEGPTSRLDFRGTPIAPRAEGEVKVEYQSGRAEIRAEIEEMPAPWTVGPYTTYVLWSVTKDGRAANLGEFAWSNGKSSLDTAAALSEFALIVTAEPHFAVSVPSKTVMLQNVGRDVKGTQSTVRELTERADYSRLAVQTPDQSGKTPIDLYGARYSVEIAEAAGAEQYAEDSLARAKNALHGSEAAQASRKSSERRKAPLMAREAIQAGEDARREAMRGKVVAEQAASEAATATAQAEAQEQAARASSAEQDSAAVRRELEARMNAVLPTQATSRGLVAVLAGVQFATGKATLTTGARESLSKFAGVIGAYPDLSLDIEGHTDATGSLSTNEKLSLDRAIAVRDYLTTQGVAASTMDASGFGFARPVADNNTADGREENRRVEIIVSGGPLVGKLN